MTIRDRVLDFEWETIIVCDIEIQVVLEVLSACLTTMTVKYTKERRSWPRFFWLVWWSDNIDDDGDTVFIVRTEEARVRICPKCAKHTIWSR
jgi:hypothetical protein